MIRGLFVNYVAQLRVCAQRAIRLSAELFCLLLLLLALSVTPFPGGGVGDWVMFRYRVF